MYISDFFRSYDYYMICAPVIFPTVTIFFDDEEGIFTASGDMLYITYSPEYNGLEKVITAETENGDHYYIDLDEVQCAALTAAINTGLEKWFNTSLDEEIKKANQEYFAGNYTAPGKIRA